MKKFISHPAVLLFFKITVSVSLLIGLIFYIDFTALLRSFRNADIFLLCFGFLLLGANIGSHFLRWRFVLKIIAPDISNSASLNSLLIGLAAGFFTPGQIGEVAGRIAAHPDLRKSHLIGITIIDKLYLLALTLITGIASLAIFASIYLPQYWHFVYGIIAALIITAIVLLFLYPEASTTLLSFIPKKFREHRVYSVIEIIETKFHNPQGRMLFLYSSLLYAVIFFQFYIFASAFSPVNFFDSCISSSSVYFIKAVVLPISIGDLGVRESAAVFFFTKFGYPAAAAFNASLCMFITNLVLPSVLGSLSVMKLKFQ